MSNRALAAFGYFATQDKLLLTLKSGSAIKNIVRNPKDCQAREL